MCAYRCLGPLAIERAPHVDTDHIVQMHRLSLHWVHIPKVRCFQISAHIYDCLFVLFYLGFNTAFNNLSFISQLCLAMTGSFYSLLESFLTGWAINSTPGIYQYLLVRKILLKWQILVN